MAIKLPIFMDYHSTTPVDPRVMEAMIPFFTTYFGNAASRNHSFGWAAEKAADNARDQVAALIGASGKEMVWTSGATESNNLAIKGAAHFYKDRGNHIITTQIEHKAVLDTCKRLELEGFEVTYLPVDHEGLISVEQVAAAIRPDTAICSVMFANNETGVIQPVAEIARVAKAKGALVHCDAIQAAGRVAVDVNELGVDYLTLSAHKIGGPQGAGALILGADLPVEPFVQGGGQERNRRGGTENVAAIAGFDRRELLAGLRVPVLCLAGEHDRNAPPAVMEQMAARIPGAQYRCIPGMGHLAHMESPLAVNAALVEFLQRRTE